MINDPGFDSYSPDEDGRWVSDKFARLAEIVQDYDPSLELRWIPPEHRTDLSDRAKPYVIWDTQRNCPVFTAGELDSPEEILARLFEGDLKNGDPFAKLMAHNAAVQALNMKAEMDAAEEKMEYAAFLMGTDKNYIQLGKGRKVDDNLRPIL